MNMKIKNQRAITLIALVITIIILLILAGISIASLTGSGLFAKAGEAKIKTEIANIEEEANLIYSELLISQYINEIDKPEMSNIVSKLIDRGYKIEEVMALSLDKDAISLSINGTATITVKYNGSPDPINYYVVINEEYYKMTLTENAVKVDRNPSEMDKTVTIETLKAESNNTNVTVESINGSVITLKGGTTAGTSTITVTYGSHTATCEINVVVRPTETSEVVEGTTFSTNHGKIDVIWLKDNTKEVVSNPNTPILTSGGESMTPVKWNDSNNIVPTTNTDTNWYNYEENRWANTRTANESYFVWIPRYAYRITYYENETSTTPTGYYDGYGQWKAEDASIRLKLDEGVDTVDYNGEKYIVHPAFDNNVEMGGWSNKLSGFWFAKFEMSGVTGADLKSIYGVESQRGQSIEKQYTNARTATYGYTGTVDLFDNKISYMNSHMTKNSEWGAVAYLTHSRYGRNAQEVTINNLGCYTGGSTGESYKTNVNQSTTGNVYGIYDMSGGGYEYTAAFFLCNGQLSDYSNWSTITGLTVESDSTKYVTKYNNYNIGKIGDGTKEVYTGTRNWFSDSFDLGSYTWTFSLRGGAYDDSQNAGIFYIRVFHNNGSNYDVFRVSLCP